MSLEKQLVEIIGHLHEEKRLGDKRAEQFYNLITAIEAGDEKVAIDALAVAGYLGAASNDGVLRTGAPLSYVDGGDFITLAFALLGIESLVDPDADRIMFWDDTAGALKWLAPDGTTVEISTTTIRVKAGGVGSTHIGTSFGAAGTNLHNFIPAVFVNRSYAAPSQPDVSAPGSAFVGKINSGGSGGLTATNVPYDTDSNEATLNITGTVDGRIVLHNLTRGNSRLVTAIDTVNNAITTVSSVDDWADNDDITAASQVCAGALEFMDLDLSNQIPASAVAVLLELGAMGSNSAQETVRVHPFEAYGSGKFQQVRTDSTGATNYNRAIVKVANQTVCVGWDDSGGATLAALYRCFGWWENADT